jgi:hypothetical protein
MMDVKPAPKTYRLEHWLEKSIAMRIITKGPFNSEVQRIGLLSYARMFFI